MQTQSLKTGSCQGKTFFLISFLIEQKAVILQWCNRKISSIVSHHIFSESNANQSVKLQAHPTTLKTTSSDTTRQESTGCWPSASVFHFSRGCKYSSPGSKQLPLLKPVGQWGYFPPLASGCHFQETGAWTVLQRYPLQLRFSSWEERMSAVQNAKEEPDPLGLL